MYELFVLACLVGSPDMCVTRAYEIAVGMPTHMPQYFPKSYKCLDMENEADKVGT